MFHAIQCIHFANAYLYEASGSIHFNISQYIKAGGEEHTHKSQMSFMKKKISRKQLVICGLTSPGLPLKA